jgi:hypothetical protein
MAERHGPAMRYPLTADLAGALAATLPEQTPVRRERRRRVTRFFGWFGRLGWRSADAASDKPLDSVPAVR